MSVLFCVSLLGCAPAEPEYKKILAEINFSSLDESAAAKRLPESVGFSVNLSFMVLEFPQKNMEVFQETIGDVGLPSLEPEQDSILKNNGILVSIGDSGNWPEFVKALDKAEPIIARQIKLIVFDSDGDDILIKKLAEPEEVFYYDSSGNLSGTTIAGSLIWHLVIADNIAKNSVDISMSPALASEDTNFYKRFMPQNKDEISRVGEILDFASFSTPAKIGDYVMISPEKFPADELSPARLLFQKDEQATSFKVYLIIVRGVID